VAQRAGLLEEGMSWSSTHYDELKERGKKTRGKFFNRAKGGVVQDVGDKRERLQKNRKKNHLG